MSSQTIKLDEIDVFIFDFDGVLTDDRVYLDQAGKESVCCNRRDGWPLMSLENCKNLLIFCLLKKTQSLLHVAKS